MKHAPTPSRTKPTPGGKGSRTPNVQAAAPLIDPNNGEPLRRRSWPHAALSPKLEIGADDHPLERQADAVANQVMAMRSPTTVASMEGVAPSDSMTSRPQGMGSRRASASPMFTTEVGNLQRWGGRPLSASVRGFLEPRMGADLSSVRTHSDAKAGALARSVQAKAFSVGRDVFFAPARYRPESRSGMHLLAHEVAHTLQPGQDRTIRRAPPEDDFVRDRTTYAELSAALRGVAYSQAATEVEDRLSTRPPESYELAALSDDELERLRREIHAAIDAGGSQNVAEHILEYNLRALRAWSEALDQQEASSRVQRMRLSSARLNAKRYSEYVMSRASSQIRAWYANMLPQALANLESLLTTGEAKEYTSKEDIRKYSYVENMVDVMEDPSQFVRHAKPVPPIVAREFIHAENSADFLLEMENIEQAVIDEFDRVEVKAVPSDTYFATIRSWANSEGSFYSAFAIDEETFEGSRRRAVARYQNGVSYPDVEDSIDYSAAAMLFKSRGAPNVKARGVNAFVRLWGEALDGHMARLAVGFLGQDEFQAGVIRFQSSVPGEFKASYSYERGSGVGRRVGAVVGVVLKGMQSDDPSALPDLILEYAWWERHEDAEDWQYEGRGDWTLPGESMQKGFSSVSGGWGYGARSQGGGVWGFSAPMPELAMLEDAAWGGD